MATFSVSVIGELLTVTYTIAAMNCTVDVTRLKLVVSLVNLIDIDSL